MSVAADRKRIWAMLTKIDGAPSSHFKNSQLLADWWQTFYTNSTEHTFLFTQDNYDRVCLVLERIRFDTEYNTPDGLSREDCRQTLNIFCSLLPGTSQQVALGLRNLARMRACLDNI